MVEEKNPVVEDVDEATNSMAISALIPLLITFILGTLCLQGFNLVFSDIGKDIGVSPAQASLITSLPSIVLGIVCFIYGSLGDFVSLRRLVTFGITILLIGSIGGFVLTMFLQPNLWVVVVARILQTAGEQVAGSSFLVVATKYLKNSLKAVFFGLYTAGYQLSASIGVFAAGWFTTMHWQYLFLIPAVTVFLLPILLQNLPEQNGSGEKVDVSGFVIFGLAVTFLTLAFSYESWWMVGVAVVLFAAFAVYINKAKNPFITPDFFRNVRWLKSVTLIACFFFLTYSVSPIFSAVAQGLYGLNSGQISNIIVWGYLTAVVTGVFSGAIMRIIGRDITLIIAALLMVIGFFGATFVVDKGIVPFAVLISFYYAGNGLIYSPVVSTVIDTLPKSESGRGVGLNDLILAVSASIGVAIIGRMLPGTEATHAEIVSATNHMLYICGGVAALGLIVFLLIRGAVDKQ